jgi:hypothetical protein
VTSRAREMPFTEDDWRELMKRHSDVKRLVSQWRKRCLNVATFPAYLAEMATVTERLFQWMDELWLYGTGGRQAFDAQIAAEDAADLDALLPAQVDHRRNRQKWSNAAALAGRLVAEARTAGDQDEARRLERAFVRTVIPWLPTALQDKEIMLDRAALIGMLRGDCPTVLIAVSLDEHPECAESALPKVAPGDDPLAFPPATTACRHIGLFAEFPRLAVSRNGQEYPHIEIHDTDGQHEG